MDTKCIGNHSRHTWPFAEAIFFALIELVNSNWSEINDLRAAVPVFLLLSTLSTVVGVAGSRTTADEATIVIGAIVAFIADAHESGWADQRIADHALSIAFLAKPSDWYTPLFAAHYQVWVMLRHLLYNYYQPTIIIFPLMAFSTFLPNPEWFDDKFAITTLLSGCRSSSTIKYSFGKETDFDASELPFWRSER